MRGAMAAALVVVLTAGCIGGGAGVATRTTAVTESPRAGDAASCPALATPTPRTTTAADSSRSGTPTATVSGFTYGPDRETQLVLSNEMHERVEMRVRVSCEATSELVHDQTYRLPRGSRLEAFDLSAVTPEGAGSSVVVTVSARNETSTVTLATTDCGEVTARVREDGSLDVWAAGC